MSFDNSPYQSPSPQPDPFKSQQVPHHQLMPDARPPVWPWYVAYCVFMALVYLVVAIIGVGLVFIAFAEDATDREELYTLVAMGVVYAGLGLLMSLLYVAGPLLPRRKWAWVWGIVNIAIGLTSPCCMIVSIPLIIFWIKPETKAWYGFKS